MAAFIGKGRRITLQGNSIDMLHTSAIKCRKTSQREDAAYHNHSYIFSLVVKISFMVWDLKITRWEKRWRRKSLALIRLSLTGSNYQVKFEGKHLAHQIHVITAFLCVFQLHWKSMISHITGYHWTQFAFWRYDTCTYRLFDEPQFALGISLFYSSQWFCKEKSFPKVCGSFCRLNSLMLR